MFPAKEKAQIVEMRVLLLLQNIVLYCKTIIAYFWSWLNFFDWKPAFVKKQHFELSYSYFVKQSDSLVKTAEVFPSSKVMATLRNKRNLTVMQEKHKGILGTTSCKIQLLLEFLKII